MNSRIFALITLVLKTLPANAQDTTRTAEPDLDTMTSGPSFAFTGREDPQLLALVFRRTYELAERPNGTTIVCLGLGRRNTVNAPAPVVQALLSNDMSARPHSACTIAPGFRHFKVTESSTGKLAFLIHITSIAHKRSEEHTSELQSRLHLVCRLLLEKKKKQTTHELHSHHIDRRQDTLFC